MCSQWESDRAHMSRKRQYFLSAFWSLWLLTKPLESPWDPSALCEIWDWGLLLGPYVFNSGLTRTKPFEFWQSSVCSVAPRRWTLYVKLLFLAFAKERKKEFIFCFEVKWVGTNVYTEFCVYICMYRSVSDELRTFPHMEESHTNMFN